MHVKVMTTCMETHSNPVYTLIFLALTKRRQCLATCIVTIMDLLSRKINDLYINEEDVGLKEPVVYSDSSVKSLPTKHGSKAESDSMLYDLLLLCGPQQDIVYAHRIALLRKAPVLNNMIEEHKNEARIILSDMKACAVETVIDFLYTGQVELKPNNIWDVLFAAEKLEINEMVNVCKEYIKENILMESWLYARQLALEKNVAWLLTIIDDYIRDNFPTLLQSEDFLQLPRLQVEIISKNEEIRTDHDRILSLVVDWCKRKLEVS